MELIQMTKFTVATENNASLTKILQMIRQLSVGDRDLLWEMMLTMQAATAGAAEFQLVPSDEERADRALRVISSPESLSEQESALLAAVISQFGHQFGGGLTDAFESRSVTQELRRVNKTLSNITTVMDGLVKKGYVEYEEGRKGSHREYRVTDRGAAEALRICRRFEETSGSPKAGVA
jgi:DNA-binding MarR family transcriptional regulator